MQARLKDVDTPSLDLYELFSGIQADSSSITSHINSFRECLHSVIVLAAQLRCQRSVYEIDESVQLEERYDDERMIDINDRDRKDSEDVERAFVSGIISKGVVRRSFAGMKDGQELICKARVLVSINMPDE